MLGGYFEQVRGGAEYQAYLLAKRLIELGHEVHYIHVDTEQVFKRTLPIELHSIQHSRVGRRLPRYAFMWDVPKVARILKEVNPDVVYQRGANAFTWVASRYAKTEGKCLVWHIANETDVKPVQMNWRNIVFGRALEKRFIVGGIKNAGVIVAQAAYQGQQLERNYGIRISGVVPNFHPMPPGIVEKNKDVVNILWAANVKPRKRPTAFLKLAEALWQRQDVRLYMVGRADNKWKTVLKDKMRELRNFYYLGEVSQEKVNDLMDRSHIFINTSEYEGFPNTFIQAWLRNVPVISLQVNPDDVLTREGIGFCSGSLEGLVRDCAMLIENYRLREDMGRRARLYAEKVHAVEPNVDRILALVMAWERASGKQAISVATH